MKNNKYEVVIKSSYSILDDGNKDTYNIYLEELIDSDNLLGYNLINNYICGGLTIEQAKAAKFGIENYMLFKAAEELVANRIKFVHDHNLSVGDNILIKTPKGNKYSVTIVSFDFKSQDNNYIYISYEDERLNISEDDIILENMENNNDK